MVFVYPEVLYALTLVPILVIAFFMAEKSRSQILSTMVEGETAPKVMAPGFEMRFARMASLCLGVIFLLMAAARPQWGRKLETVKHRGIDIIIALDVSESMRAEDVAPSRMQKARQEVNLFLEKLKGDRVGLIAFAGSAFTYCPLTVDYSAIQMFLSSLEPGVISDGGTDISAATREAVDVFERSQSSASKVLVIFSDGEHHEKDPRSEIKEAVERGIKVFTVGVGHVGKSGARIPLEGEEGAFKRDRYGNLVITRLDEATLKQVAEMGGGKYYRITESGRELVAIYDYLSKMEKRDFNSRLQDQRQDYFQLLLQLGLVFLTISYAIGDHTLKRKRRTQRRAS
ncbi:MAG: hypothetical protein CSA81_04490 [Acidobacteria bacterium]|nr:MAG: hypothetical protein CSA81_04490 [Acidobacteriota bacterium]